VSRDQVVVVTGVTGFGLGAALAKLLALEGARVVGAGRRVPEGEAWEKAVRRDGGEATFVPCDVSRVEDCQRLIAAAVERYGQVDALVNNAGVVGDPPLLASHQADEEWWDRVMDINLKGAFFCARFAVEHMLPRGSGVIVNIASLRAVAPGPMMIAYAVSKAGMVHMGVSLAEELRGSGIRVNNVLLGGVEGEAGTTVMGAMPDLDPEVRAVVMGPASGRKVLEPSVVADAVAALLDPACRAMTGATIAVG
jgi:NAD(P)-dependent dehydrogenase (short-subunit alcohol dehydrogenase family)